MGFNIQVASEFATHAPRAQSRVRAGQSLEWFIGFQILCQLALLVPQLGTLRSMFRIAAFGASIYMLIAHPAQAKRRHTCAIAAVAILFILTISLFNPTTNSWAAGIAQVALYVAILGPLFWVPALSVDVNAMNRVLLIFWGFYALSSVFGVLQVLFPGHFQPPLAPQFAGGGYDYLKSFMIQTNNGENVFRPMGLTDTPGGAAVGGFYTLLLSMGLLVTESRTKYRLLFAGSMAVGLSAIGLSQVRSVLVMAAVGSAIFLGLLLALKMKLAQRPRRFANHRRQIKLSFLVAVVAAVVVIGSVLALSLARKSVSDRIATLFADQSTSEIYYSNRGHFLTYTLDNLLPEYPLGAGLGRWGMTYQYFGDHLNLASFPIWVEIQWTGWLLDGGIPLVLAYLVALCMALKVALKITFDPGNAQLSVFGALMFAYDVSALADTFDYAFFISQRGLEFWLLNAVLFAAAQAEARRGSGRKLI